MKTRRCQAQTDPVMINNRRTRNFICLVDQHRRPSRQRSTEGRYRVGAKNEKQARKLPQKAIGFGSIVVYYQDNTDKVSDLVPLGQCMKERFDPETGRFDHVPARHATDKTGPCEKR